MGLRESCSAHGALGSWVQLRNLVYGVLLGVSEEELGGMEMGMRTMGGAGQKWPKWLVMSSVMDSVTGPVTGSVMGQ